MPKLKLLPFLLHNTSCINPKDILLFYVVNLDAVNLFANLFFTFLAILNYLVYQFESIYIVLFV